MVWEFLEAFKNVRDKQKVYADDSIAKLNRVTTVSILIVVALFMTAKSYTADQIECNGEVNEISVKRDYVKSICWVKDIYQADDYNDQHPINGDRFNFYPWMPVITLFLAFCFYSPYLIWKSMLRNSIYQHMPIDINGIVDILNKSTIIEKKKFNSHIESVSIYLDRCFSLNNYQDSLDDELEDLENISNHKKLINKQPKSTMYRIRGAKRLFIPLFINYLFVKLIYLAISVSIFGIIDLIFKFKESFYLFGIKMISAMYIQQHDDTAYLNSTYFPRVVLCQVHSKEDVSGNVMKSPYQCVLSANFLNEKIFIVLWLWFCFMVVMNLLSLLNWCYIMLARKRIIYELLSWPFNYDSSIEANLDPFVKKYLRTEGFLVLMLIKSNSQDWHCRMVVNLLWKNYLKRNLDGELNAVHVSNVSSGEGSGFEYSSEEKYHLNKSPVSSQTVKIDNRRKLNMNLEVPLNL